MGVVAQVVILPKEDAPLRIEEIELPAPRPHQVVISQFASGICHSQLHQIQRPRDAPALLGHESTGVVITAGNEVTHVKVGDRVMVTWVPRPVSRIPEDTELTLGDGTTVVCRTVFTWADHTIADEAFVVPLPEEAPTDVTAVIGCAVMTGAGAVIRTAQVGPGQSVAVFGVGGIGLSTVAAAAITGADPVIAVDLDDRKLEMAKSFGATDLFNASKADPVEAIRSLTRRPGEADVAAGPGVAARPAGGVDFAFDCIGVKVTTEQIFEATRFGAAGLRPGGTAVLIGIPPDDVHFSGRTLVLADKSYRGSVGGSCEPDRDFPIFLSWHQSRKLDLDSLVTDRFAMAQINEATKALEEGQIMGRAILVFHH